jgi:hypothetical protein
MPTFLKNKKIVAAGVIVILLALVYWEFFSSSGSSTPLSSSTPTATSPASQDLLVALTNLQTIQLNSAIFSDPVFESLTDFGVTIPPQVAGRQDPFLPLSPSSPAPSGAPVLTLPVSH